MRPRAYYEQLLAGMPPGLERAILSVLRFHVGKSEAIEKEPLILALEKIGFHLSDERQARLAIVRLRKTGVPVCSSSTDAGYFLPADFDEFAEFVGREYWKKITDMAETARALGDGIEAVFPGEMARWRAANAQPDLDAIPVELPRRERAVQGSLF